MKIGYMVRRKKGDTAEYGRVLELDATRARVLWIGRLLADGGLELYPYRARMRKITWARQASLVVELEGEGL